MIILLALQFSIVYTTAVVGAAHAAALALTFLGRAVLGYLLFGAAAGVHYVVLVKWGGIHALRQSLELLQLL